MNRLFLCWCHSQKVSIQIVIPDHRLKWDSRNENCHSHHSHSHLVLNGMLNKKNCQKKKSIWFWSTQRWMLNANVELYVKWMFIKFHLLVNLTLSHRSGWRFVCDFMKWNCISNGLVSFHFIVSHQMNYLGLWLPVKTQCPDINQIMIMF